MMNSEDPMLRSRIEELQQSLFADAISEQVVQQPFEGAYALEEVCDFVNAVISDKVLSIGTELMRNKKPRYVGSSQAMIFFKYLPLLVKVTNCLPKCYRYSGSIDLFMEACRNTQQLEDSIKAGDLWRCKLGPGDSTGFDCLVVIFNRLVGEIKRLYMNGGFKQRIAAQRHYLNRRHANDCRWIDKIFEACHRVSVLRLDLGYDKEFASQMSLQELSDDIDHLRNNYRHSPIFHDKIADYFKIEYGIDRGPHCHAVFFFNGSKRNPISHIHHAQEIGEYWKKDITKGRGYYYNCNADAEDHENNGNRGIGDIHHYDSRLIDNLKEKVFAYFVKSDQFVQVATNPRFKRFRRSQAPEYLARRPRAIFFSTQDDSLFERMM